MLAAVKDRREQEKLRDRIDQLKIEPAQQGKALVDILAGFWSVRAVRQRYRIVYKVELEQVVVVVIGCTQATCNFCAPLSNAVLTYSTTTQD
jgi:mRNA interferase RelE/StbE